MSGDLRLQERRRAIRFEMELQVSYRPKYSKTVNVGKLINISSVGILFAAQDDLPIEMLVEVIVDWPIKRNGEVPLTLSIHGRVVRHQARAVALEIGRVVWCTAVTPSPAS